MEQLVTKFSYIVFGFNPLLTCFLLACLILFLSFISRKLKYKNIFLFLLSSLPLFLIFFRLMFNDYFLSDDFDHFVLSANNSYWELFIKGITANGAWAFHRLFTAFLVFKVIYDLFGPAYQVFLIFNFIIHLANLYLLHLLYGRFSKNMYLKSLVLFCFSFFYLTWISNIHELLAGLFFLLSINTLIFWKKSKEKHKYLPFVGFIFYVLAVGSKEITFVLPIVLVVLLKLLKINTKKLGLFKIFFVFYLFVLGFDYLGLSKLDANSGYTTDLSLVNIYNHLGFYISGIIPILSEYLAVPIVLIGLLYFDFRNKKFQILPLFICFLLLLGPAVALVKSTIYYAYIPSFFLYLIFLIVLEKVSKKISHKRYLLNSLLISLFLVFVFKVNVPLQENVFLLQYPRKHQRKIAVETIVNLAKLNLPTNQNKIVKLDLSEGVNNETEWFLSNRYLNYFLAKPDRFKYNFKYNTQEKTLVIEKI